MGKRDIDSDDDDGGKRRKGGFSDHAPPDDGQSAEIQLDHMLAGGAGLGGIGLGGVGVGLGMGNMGMPSMAPTPGLSAPGGAVPDLDPLKPATTPMDFSKLGANMPSQEFPVPRDMVEYLMTPEHRQILLEETGCDVDWAPDESKVQLKGSAEQIRKAQRLLQRVLMHCNWGRSEAKVRRLLKPKIIESAVLRLSPMNTLPAGQKTLSQTQPVISIGKDKKINDIVIPAAIVSRQHCVLELDIDRGAIYVIDCSTNGTFLNGLRLPPRTTGKVLVSHGDELLLQDPANDQEFGYVVNIQELNVREQTKLQAPRRLLSTEESSTMGRDFY